MTFPTEITDHHKADLHQKCVYLVAQFKSKSLTLWQKYTEELKTLKVEDSWDYFHMLLVEYQKLVDKPDIKKAATKATSPKKEVKKEASAKKAPAKKVAKKAPAKKLAVKKAPKKVVTKKAPAKKVIAKKTITKKIAPKKPINKAPAKKVSKKAKKK